MKKLALVSSLAIALLSGQAAIAASQSGYYSTVGPVVARTALNGGAFFPATDITVINASSDQICVTKPVSRCASPKSDPIHIRNSDGAFNTLVQIQTSNGINLFNQTVCARALITIYGGNGNYKWNLDNEFCN